jgi:thiol-disulfide isomerase/thioredoxin
VPAAAAAIAIVVVLGVVLQPDGSSGSAGDAGENWTLQVPDMEVPDFGVRTTSWSGGEEFVLSNNLERPTVLYFVAAWCFTCIPETQALAKIHEELGDQLNILIIDVDTTEDEDDLKRFKDSADGGDHLWVMDDGNRISQAFNVRTLDTTIIIDQTGVEAFRDSVPTGYNRLKSELTALLENRPVTPVPELDLPGTFYPDIGREHLQPGETYDRYLSDPPTSGPHDPQPVPWGPYNEPIPKEKLVHNLEHGGLLVLYNCPEGCTELVEELEPFVGRYAASGVKLVLAPYPGMDSRLALVAWGYLDTFDELDPERIAQFLEADLGSRGPEANVQ